MDKNSYSYKFHYVVAAGAYGLYRNQMLCERTGTLLGNPQLYETSEDVKKEELEDLRPVFEDMFDCIKGIRRDYGFGRAIAAP